LPIRGFGPRVAPEVPFRGFGPRVAPEVPFRGFAPEGPWVGPKSVPILPTGPKVALKPIPKVLYDPRVPLPANLTGQRYALHTHAATRDLEPFVQAARVRPAELPTVVGRHLETLEAKASELMVLGHLRDLVHGPWPQDIRAEDVENAVKAFETTSLPEAPTLRRYLALRAEMEGQREVARLLLPPGEVRDARSVLRDLKALEEFSATPFPTSPLGDLPLPEPVPLSLKPSVREALNKDLPDLFEKLPGTEEKLPDAELRARRGALRAIETSAGMRWDHVAISLHNLKGVTIGCDPDDREAEVERQLGRPLAPEERLLVRRLLRTKTTAEVVSILRRIEPKQSADWPSHQRRNSNGERR
jgi:hypothetical protein